LLEGAAKNVERALFVVSGRVIWLMITTPESASFCLFPLPQNPQNKSAEVVPKVTETDNQEENQNNQTTNSTEVYHDSRSGTSEPIFRPLFPLASPASRFSTANLETCLILVMSYRARIAETGPARAGF